MGRIALQYADLEFYGNTLRGWVIALALAVVAFLVIKLVVLGLVRGLSRLSKRTRTQMDNVVVEVIAATRSWFVGAVALFAGSLPLVLPDRLRDLIESAAVLVILVQIGVWGRVAIRSSVERFSSRRIEDDPASVTTVRALGFLATVFLGSVLVLMALSNFGVDITALVAGLGIGGVAIALAVQNILGDLFASLSIVLDKPFVYGDFIVVDDLKGTVENVGLKTTRVRSLSGEQLVFSNSDLLKSRIRNYKRMYERRVVFSVGVVYQTPSEKLERIPGMLRDIVEEQADVRFDRAHFSELGAFSLNFEIVYFVQASDFNLYMDRHQAICLEIFRRFEQEGIAFAYPTQTLFVARENGTGGASESLREPGAVGADGWNGPR
jgi:small-conductance mechanosensitive channel